MIEINRHNYEAFYLDYLEGNLDAEVTEQLLLFLEKNPAIKSELEEFNLIELKADPEVKLDTKTLQQNINPDNVEDYIIASIENQLDTDDALELSEYLSQSPEAKILAERYKKTILRKPEIYYPELNKLRKKVPAVYYITPLVSAAAAALIFILVNIGPVKESNTSVVSQQTETIQPDSSNKELFTDEKPVIVESNAETKKDLTTGINTFQSAETAGDKESEPELIAEIIQIASEENDESTVIQQPDLNALNTTNNMQQSIDSTNSLINTMQLVEIPEQQEKGTGKEIKTDSKGYRGSRLLTIARLGLKAFGKLNERNYDVEPNFTNSGEIKSVTIRTDNRKITTTAI